MKLHPAVSPKWLSRDAKMIILARGVRTFAQGFVAVLLALYLTELGFSLVQIGAFLSVGVVGVAFFAFLVSLIVGRVGRRTLLIFFSMISASAGLALFFVDHFLILLVFAFLGSLSTGGGGGGESPAQPLEVASLPILRRTTSGLTSSLSTTLLPGLARRWVPWRRGYRRFTRVLSI